MTIQEASNKVREFMEMTDNPIPTKFGLEDFKLCSHLIEEETNELIEGLFMSRPEDALDGAADSLFVILFALHKMGIADKLDAMMEEVCRSNMTKLWKEKEVDIAFMDLQFAGQHTFLFGGKFLDGNKVYVVKRISDGKVIKSPSYSPADAKGILES